MAENSANSDLPKEFEKLGLTVANSTSNMTANPPANSILSEIRDVLQTFVNATLEHQQKSTEELKENQKTIREMSEELKNVKKELVDIREQLMKKDDEDVIEILVEYHFRNGTGRFVTKVRRAYKIKVLKLKMWEKLTKMIGNGEYYFCKPDRKVINPDSKFSDHNIEAGDTIYFKEN